MLPVMSTSFHGRIIDVDYVLKLFVKHESWNEFGEGQAVSLPIQILTPPLQMQAQEQV